MRGPLPSALQARLAAGELRPYVVARPSLLPSLDLAPGGVTVRPEHTFDPLRAATSPFLDRIERLDALAFAPRGLATPRWALYDCACLPGVIFGLGSPAATLGPATRAALGAETAAADDLVPLSSLIAIPMLGDDRWLAYALAVAPPASAIPHLDEATLALGIDLLRAREITTTAQWSSPELAAFASAAPPHVLAASLPSHDVPETAVLRLRAPAATSAATTATAAASTVTSTPTVASARGAASSRPRSAESDRAPRPPAPALHPANAHLLRDLEPFVVATPDHLARLDLAPFGLSIAADARIDPLAPGAAPFLDRLARLDALTFGPEGMPMPRWLFFDGAALPGGIVGFARRAAALDNEARSLFGAPDDPRALVPFAMYIAVPAHDPGTWIGHNLASIAERLPSHHLAGLGRLTKAVALAAYRASTQIGATQWASRALHVHARLGPLALLSAWTPAHRDPATLTYRATISEPALRHLAGDPAGHIAEPAPDLWLDSADPAAMRSLQARIEAGEPFCICGPPETIAPGRQRVPVARERPVGTAP